MSVNHVGGVNRGFVPGLVLGLVIGAFAGAVLPPLLTGQKLPAAKDRPAPSQPSERESFPLPEDPAAGAGDPSLATPEETPEQTDDPPGGETEDVDDGGR